MAHRQEKIIIKTPREIQKIREAGYLVAETLARAGEMCKPGVSTEEINQFVHQFTLKHNAIPAPLNYPGGGRHGKIPFPKACCISVNNVVLHGIPSPDEILKEGDILNIDVTSILDGYYADASRMFCVGKVHPNAQELVDATKMMMEEGIRVAGLPRARFNDIGNIINGIAEEYGYSVTQNFTGHGVGRHFHEEPTIYHYRQREETRLIEPGMVFTIEPMINEGTHKNKTLKDGWTTVTEDGLLSAQWEETVVRTKDGIEILTLPR
jgi:methionyl aminopeptidase